MRNRTQINPPLAQVVGVPDARLEEAALTEWAMLATKVQKHKLKGAFRLE